MSQPEEKMAMELLGLSRKARARLAAKLIESLDDEDEDDVEELWAQEAQRRLSEIRDIDKDCVPAEEAFDKLRARYT